MKIVNATRPSMLLEDVCPGDCFWDEDNDALVMKTDCTDEFNDYLCVYLEDGDTSYFSRDRAVTVMNVTAVIKDEEETQD